MLRPATRYSNSRTIVTSAILIVIGIFSTAYTSKNPQRYETVSSWFDELTLPVSSSVSSFLTTTASIYSRYVSLLSVQGEYQRVRERVVALEGENVRLLELVNENRQLREILGMSSALALQGGVGAAVIGHNASDRFQSVTVDRGESSGIKVGMAVVDSSGVVGQIVSVSPNSSRILLITDIRSGVDVVIQSSRVRGVVEGLGKVNCNLNYVGKDEKIEVGDRVVTSGADGVFPKGLPVGLVLAAEKVGGRLFQAITLQPYMKLSKLEYVYVITNYSTGH